ncbi:MAG: NAD-dependent epimerase/dehydratase family protein [Methylotenera sp.]
MKVAVTGASGFVGKNVLTALTRENVEVFAITRDGEKLASIDKSINVIDLDICDCDSNSFEKIGSPDVLIHLAWDGLPNYKSLHHFETELLIQYKFLKNVIDSGLVSLLVTGTCFEYGMQSGALSEEMITKPNNPYGFAKDALHQQLGFLKLIKPFNLIWARLFYMYGETQANTSLYSQLREAVKRGDKVFNMSGGEQLRDYLHVDEVSRQIVRLALMQHDIGTINICSGKPISVHEQVESWLHENNWKIRLNLGYYPYPDYEPMAFWGDRQYLDATLERQ